MAGVANGEQVIIDGAVVPATPRRPAPIYWRAFALTAPCVAWVAGVLLAVLWPGLGADVALPLALAGAACSVPLALAWPHQQLRWTVLLFALFLLGLARCAASLPPAIAEAGSLRRYNVVADNSAVQQALPLHVRGVLVEQPVVINPTVARLRVEASAVYIGGEWQPVHGSLLALTTRYSDADNGDLVLVSGVVQDPPGFEGFDYAEYLLRRGVGSYVRNAAVTVLVPDYSDGPGTLLGDWRRAAGERISRQMPEPAAGLLRGILLGETSSIDPDLRNAFVVTGTFHILAISGTNITLLLLVAFMLLRGSVGLVGAAVVGGLFIGFYASFVLFGWSIGRAALMAGLYLLARLLGRPATPHIILALSAFLLTAIDPLAVIDLGFDLSFVAMLGLFILLDLINIRLTKHSRLLKAVVLSFGIQLFIVPVFAMHMGGAIIVAPIAGLLIEPLLLPIMVLGLSQLVLGVFLEPLSALIGWATWVLLELMMFIVRELAQLPLDLIGIKDLGLGWFFVWYVVLAIVIWYLHNRPARRDLVRVS